MNPTSSTPNTDTLQANEPGDLLALATYIFGYTPTESVVIIGIQDTGNTGGHLRLDLTPALENPYLVAMRYLPFFTDEHVAAMILIITEKEPTQGATSTRAARFTEIISEAFDIVDIGVASAFHIGGNHARALDCTDPNCCPYPGETVTTVNPAALELTLHTGPTPDQVLDSFTAAEPDPLFAAEITDTPVTAEHGLQVWDAVASEELPVENLTTADMASLLATLTSPHAVITTTTTDLATGYRALTAGTSGQTLRTATDTTGDTPNWDRVDHVIATLKLLAPYANDTTGANLYAVMGWISFAQGKGTLSGLFTDHALTLEPANRLAETVAAQTKNSVSGWARHRDTAYPGPTD